MCKEHNISVQTNNWESWIKRCGLLSVFLRGLLIIYIHMNDPKWNWNGKANLWIGHQVQSIKKGT